MNEQNKVAVASKTGQIASANGENKNVAETKTPATETKVLAPATETKALAPATETKAPEVETDKPLVDMDMAMGVLASSKSRKSGGSKIRPNVGYTLVAAKLKEMTNTTVPEQEQVIMKILLGALTVQKPVISEPDLHKLVLAAHAAGKLKTKQDAWHIFRYYRTDLLKRAVLEQVEIAA